MSPLGPTPSAAPVNDSVAETQTSDADERVSISYYTDPLCSWSWALEAEWRRLRYELGPGLNWRYVMGGLLSDWQKYEDPIHAVTRPAQMGPLWFEMHHLSGMPVDERIWYENPPDSSYLACLAIKAAGRQGDVAEELYLRGVREAVMLRRGNLAQRDVLEAVADALAAHPPHNGFDAARFRQHLDDPETAALLRADLQETRYLGIARFPSLVMRGRGGRALLITGYRPYSVLREAVADLAPDIQPTRTARDAVEYVRHWQSATAHEVAVALDASAESATDMLDEAVALGSLRREELRGPRTAIYASIAE